MSGPKRAKVGTSLAAIAATIVMFVFMASVIVNPNANAAGKLASIGGILVAYFFVTGFIIAFSMEFGDWK